MDGVRGRRPPPIEKIPSPPRRDRKKSPEKGCTARSNSVSPYRGNLWLFTGTPSKDKQFSGIHSTANNHSLTSDKWELPRFISRNRDKKLWNKESCSPKRVDLIVYGFLRVAVGSWPHCPIRRPAAARIVPCTPVPRAERR